MRRTFVALAALALLVAGCGDDDDDTVDDALSAADEAASDVQDAASDAISEAQDAASDAADAASDAIDDASDAIDDATGGDSVTIANFTFSAPAEVAAGTTLSVANNDTASHTMTADDGSFDTGTIAGGESAEVTLDAPGEYAFHCDIHPTMTGTITVS